MAEPTLEWREPPIGDRAAYQASCHSFSVGLSTMLEQLDNRGLVQFVTAITDPSPGLAKAITVLRRDEAVRELVERLGSARKVAAALDHYLRGNWLRDREAGAPAGDPVRDALFRVALFHGGKTLSDHWISTIVREGTGRSHFSAGANFTP